MNDFFQEDMGNLIKRDEFSQMSGAMKYLKKDHDKLCSKEEMITRLTVLHSEFNVRMEDRPTISYFKTALGVYDKKIDAVERFLEA